MLEKCLVFHLENRDYSGIWASKLEDVRIFAKSLGFSTIHIIDNTIDGWFTGIGDSEINFQRHLTLDDWWTTISEDDIVIGLETEDTIANANQTPINIVDVDHPTDGKVWYIFGPSMGFDANFIDSNKQWVYLPLANTLSAQEALVMTLTHRFFTTDVVE